MALAVGDKVRIKKVPLSSVGLAFAANDIYGVEGVVTKPYSSTRWYVKAVNPRTGRTFEYYFDESMLEKITLFKQGDKVRIKPDITKEQLDRIYIRKDLTSFAGSKATVTSIYGDNGAYIEGVDNNGSKYNYSINFDMIEHYEEEKKMPESMEEYKALVKSVALKYAVKLDVCEELDDFFEELGIDPVTEDGDWTIKLKDISYETLKDVMNNLSEDSIKADVIGRTDSE